ncbi:MAG: peptidoglycan-N-acetylglucosamine deacetylase [Chloroflexota bacterium]|nr:peptidoglycan-N-acetylglucosamine deacetylase [Chloroflexota bacterium]
MTRENACISIDVDTLSSIYKGLGCTHPGGYTYIELRTGLENLARFFEKLNIKTTLFMVGNDFTHVENQAHIRDIHKAGHEIANHSMSHPQGFRYLSPQEKENEIAGMGEICKEVTGEYPLGFRSPGWNVDDATIPILKKHGYIYESSVFPTSIMPLMKMVHWFNMSKQTKTDRTTMGQMNYMFAPTQPYHTSAKSLASQGKDGLVEFPISVSPTLRIPFFATFLLMTGTTLNQVTYRRMRNKHLPIHFQMHLSDFVDYSLPELEGQMPEPGSGTAIPQALHTPLSKKMEVFGTMIEQIAADYNFITLKQWTQRIAD